MNQTNDKNIVSEMIETQREYINTLLQEKYYLSEENKLLQERARQNELLIDTMQVKYISYLDDYAKNSIVLTEKIKLLETEMANLKKELEKEKEKNLPIGVRINDLDDDWDWEWKTHVENKEKYLTEFIYSNQVGKPKYTTTETQTDHDDIHNDHHEYSETTINDESTINENNKTIFPDLSSILEDSCNDLEEYIDKYDSYLFERF
jgi:formyltetrahydrofolate synthetase